MNASAIEPMPGGSPKRSADKQASSNSRPASGHFWLVVAFITLNVVALLVVFGRMMPEYPIGWDTPYYMSRIRYFEEQAVLSNRIGFISFMSFLHTVLGISLVKLHILFTVAITTLIAWASGLLASRIFRARQLAFALTFFLTFWHQSYFALGITTFDNALGLALTLCTLLAIVVAKRDWKTAIPPTLLAILLALTHFESFVFLVAIVGLYGFFMMLRQWSIRRVLSSHRFVIVGLLLAIAVAYFQWSNIIAAIVSTYAGEADPTGNASIPYAKEQSLKEFFTLSKTGITQSPESILFLFGGILLLWVTFRRWRGSRAPLMVLAYVVTAYLVLLFSVLRGSIPINRSILLLPTPMVIGIGVSQIFFFLRERFRFATRLLQAVLLIAIIVPVPNYLDLVRRFPISIHAKTYEGLQNLRDVVENEKVTHFVIITNTQHNVRAASAYYGLWRYWALSILPLPTAMSDFCVYFGDISAYHQGVPTQRDTNQEYNDTSLESVRCLKTLPAGHQAFFIEGLYPAAFPLRDAAGTTTQVAPSVWRLNQ